MSFDISNDYIVNRLKLMGYAQSSEPYNFENAPQSEYGNTFILYPEGGELTGEGENLNIRFYDTQVWNILIAFNKSDMNDVISRNMSFRKIEAIIKDLDNPTNWLETLRYMRYQSWNMEELQNYFLLTIKIAVQDTVTY